MERALSWWQHIPTSLEPVALGLGSLSIYWYALFFLFGSWLVYWLAEKEYIRLQILTKKEYTDFSFWIFVSALAGGKIGFLFLYWWPFIEREQSFVPMLANGSVGLPGMSFVGGMIGVVLYVYWYARQKQKNFFVLTDVLALFVPLAILFGRLGSFIHGELIGRITQASWGMYFTCPPQCEALGVANETVLRHPSTLYAAFLEGAVLFVFLLLIKKRVPNKREGTLTALFCIGYGVLRFMSECFREPDKQIGYIGMLTLNQIFAVGIILLGLVILKAVKSHTPLRNRVSK